MGQKSWVGRKLRFSDIRLQISHSILSINEYQRLSMWILILHVKKNDLRFPHADCSTFFCVKKLHYKMRTDTTLLWSVQPGFLKLRVKIPCLPMVFLRKVSDRLKFRVSSCPRPPPSPYPSTMPLFYALSLCSPLSVKYFHVTVASSSKCPDTDMFGTSSNLRCFCMHWNKQLN